MWQSATLSFGIRELDLYNHFVLLFQGITAGVSSCKNSENFIMCKNRQFLKTVYPGRFVCNMHKILTDTDGGRVKEFVKFFTTCLCLRKEWRKI